MTNNFFCTSWQNDFHMHINLAFYYKNLREGIN